MKRKRYLICGDYPNSGGWSGFSESYSRRSMAVLAARYWLDQGYNVLLEDTFAHVSWNLEYGFDGRGIS